MKGPGLPGWKNQKANGFYKSAPRLNASKRSPVLQGEGEGQMEELLTKSGLTKEEVDRARQSYMDLSPEQRQKLSWKSYVSKEAETKRGTLVTTLKTAKIPGGGTGVSWYDKWETLPDSEKGKYDGDINKFIDAGKRWNEENPKLFALLDQMETEIDRDPETPKDDVEMTNFSINLTRKGIGTHTVHKDKGDGSFRYNVDNYGGELSAYDINQGVLDGKWKYELTAGGEATGNLIMSKDYYENKVQRWEEMKKRGDERYEEHKATIDEVTNWKTRDAWVRKEIAEKHPEIKEKSWFKNIMDGEGKGVTKKFTNLKNDLIKQYKNDHAEAYAEKKCGYCGTKNDPANYGHFNVSITPDDEAEPTSANIKDQVFIADDYKWDEDNGKYTLKEGASSVDPRVWNNMSDRERTEHNAKFNPKFKEHKNLKKEEFQLGATPYHQMLQTIESYNKMTEEEKASKEGKELHKDITHAYAVRGSDRHVAERSGNIDTDYEIDDEGNVIN